jgi:hypothetical protein
VIFTVIQAEALDPLIRDIRAYCDDCGEKLKMIVWGVEQALRARTVEFSPRLTPRPLALISLVGYTSKGEGPCERNPTNSLRG